MRLPCGELAFGGAAQMRGHQLLAVIDLTGMGTQAHLPGLADQLVGQRVVSAFDLDVVVQSNIRILSRGTLLAMRGQRAQRWTLELGEQAGARTGATLEWAGVEIA